MANQFSETLSESKVAMKSERVDHCDFFVVRKKRYCRMFVPDGKRFCAEHSLKEDRSSTASNNVDGEEVRVSCPLDPKHNCLESKLAKHLKVCPAANKRVDDTYSVPSANHPSQL